MAAMFDPFYSSLLLCLLKKEKQLILSWKETVGGESATRAAV